MLTALRSLECGTTESRVKRGWLEMNSGALARRVNVPHVVMPGRSTADVRRTSGGSRIIAPILWFQPQRWRLCSRGLTPARPSASFRKGSIINLDSQVVCNRIEKQGYQPRYGVEHLSMEQVKAHSAAVLRSAGLQKIQIQAERYERSGPRSPYGNHCTRSKPSSLRD